jgi:hypothetical protein
MGFYQISALAVGAHIYIRILEYIGNTKDIGVERRLL